MTASRNLLATEHVPFFITAPGDTDVVFNITVVFTVATVVLTGVVFLTIHSLPDRIAHKSKKVQLDVVALLSLLGLLMHENILWIAAILLAFIDIPDFLTPLGRMVTAVETPAGRKAPGKPADPPDSNLSKAVIADQPRQDQKGSVSRIPS